MLDKFAPLRAPAFAVALSELDDLLSQSNKVFLLGAGCSKCAGLPLTTELTEQTLACETLDETTIKILTAIKGKFEGAKAANIEDYLSELVDMVAITERRDARGANISTVSLDGNDYSVQQLKDAVDQIKFAIVKMLDVNVDLEVHLKFIQAVHRPLRPGRVVVARTVDYLILNYDTLIESALALQKLQYVDGMNGGSSAWWDIKTFEKIGIDARILKLHGSIDWSEIPGDILPRRIAKNLRLPAGNEGKILIWPASTKYRETQRDPYAQLLNLARCALRPQSSSQTVLIVCGYSCCRARGNVEKRALGCLF